MLTVPFFMISRALEALGIPTLCMSSAKDIIESGRPPRATFVNYPLGHTTGIPFDSDNQLTLLRQTLTIFEQQTVPGQIVTLPHIWPDTGWQESAMRSDAGDTRSVRDDSPQWQFEEDRIRAGY